MRGFINLEDYIINTKAKVYIDLEVKENHQPLYKVTSIQINKYERPN